MTVVLIVVMFGLVAGLVVLASAAAQARRRDCVQFKQEHLDMFEEECRALEATRKRCQP